MGRTKQTARKRVGEKVFKNQKRRRTKKIVPKETAEERKERQRKENECKQGAHCTIFKCRWTHPPRTLDYALDEASIKLYLACQTNDIELVKSLLQSGDGDGDGDGTNKPGVNKRRKENKQTPLFCACEKGKKNQKNQNKNDITNLLVKLKIKK